VLTLLERDSNSDRSWDLARFIRANLRRAGKRA